MMTERQVQETIARCVSIAVYYHGGERTAYASDRMASEVRATALALGEMGLSVKEARGRIVDPVGRELIARFGPALGGRIVSDFADAFEGKDPDAVLSPNGRYRTRAQGKSSVVA